MAGLFLVVRAILAAHRAGIRRFFLPSRLWTPQMADRVGHQNIGVEISRLDRLSREERSSLTQEPALLLPATTVAEPRTLQGFLTGGPYTSELEGVALNGLPSVILAGPRLLARLLDRMVEELPVGDLMEAGCQKATIGRFSNPDRAGVVVTDRAQLPEVETILFNSLGTHMDGVIDRAIHRRYSRVLTRHLVRLPVTPNQVTLVSLAFGLLAAWGFWTPFPAAVILGIFLYEVAVILDHSDGEIARLKFLDSRAGDRLDFFVDTITNALIVLGMGVATFRLGGGKGTLIAGGLCALGISLCSLFARLLVRHTGGETDSVGLALRRMAPRDLFYAVFLGYLGCLSWAPWALPLLLWFLAIGSNSYWIGCLTQRIRER